jgi:hypothetical protein
MPTSLTRRLAMLVVSIVGASLAVHAWHAVSTAVYVDFVTGVWLTLANDLVHGVFYRDLVGPDGYGGTRYFPLFFASIGALMRLGLGPLAAGFLVSAVAAVLLVTGIRRVLSKLGLPPDIAAALAIFVLAPRFLQQGLLAIRSDLLAAGLVVWGLDISLSASDKERPAAKTLAAAAVCFTLAVATKVTSLYAPAGVTLALLWARRPGVAFRLAGMVAAGIAVMVAVVAAASGGRAVESWLSCGLAGAGFAEWLANAPAVVFSQIIGPSRVFTAALLAAALAWLAMIRARGPKMLIVLFPVTLAATVVVLASPGTSYTNQLVDASAMGLVVIGWALARYPRARVPAVAVLLLLSLAAARQSLMPATNTALRQHAWRMAAERDGLVRELAALPAPVLSESPELLVLGGTRPYLLDSFTLCERSIRWPDQLVRLHGDLNAQRFARVVLMFDPDTASGRGWHTNIDSG